jgi:N-acetylmuramoyl-L-alanine amidase
MNQLNRSYYGHLNVWVFLALFLTGCATAPKPAAINPAASKTPVYTGLNIIQGPTSQGAEPRKDKITHLVLHYTAGTLPSSLDILQGKDRAHKVGVHYVLTDEPNPRIIRMVPESLAAFHAGKSGWADTTSLNQRSIGIEIINLDGNVHSYSAAQADMLFTLCSDIIRRYGIRPENVVGHSDIAVGRKVDPGSLFPWPKLASLGVGAWPLPEEVKANLAKPRTLPPAEIRQLLTVYGYHLEAGDAGLKLGLEAFQRHFRPSRIDGLADPESLAILQALVRRYRSEDLRKARLQRKV